VLLMGNKGFCDRCAKFAKPAFQKVAQCRAQGVPQVEMARRLGTKRRRIGIIVDLN
jgi:transcriptional regulator